MSRHAGHATQVMLHDDLKNCISHVMILHSTYACFMRVSVYMTYAGVYGCVHMSAYLPLASREWRNGVQL